MTQADYFKILTASIADKKLHDLIDCLLDSHLAMEPGAPFRLAFEDFLKLFKADRERVRDILAGKDAASH